MDIIRPATRILAISGSLRADSVNTSLLRAAAAVSGDDTWVELWCGLGAIPPFNEDGEHDTPASVADMRAAIAGADALLISTPEYNGSIPGQLKNALDWASRPYGESVLTGKVVGVTSAGPGDYGGAWAAEHLGKVLRIAGGEVLEPSFSLPLADRAFEPGTDVLRDPAHTAALADLVSALQTAARPALAAVS
ncbi:chromate reductase [Pseudonocardia hierapolitana]|uniref:Chromate reductase n=1 Tax=Pseudonocardia hierapolitana TaxID=1128676 RepID=A0A561SR67_9PSEU|nr:NADPH-dependent FMN reductase [Pseudonocardia hierapolitana]TWF77353.1 chromate reductase [Pseudonocardia hierapolitana]